ncbi:Phosphate acetyltransferase [Listeria grayi]|uniref:Phosphate acetyltransferase n=3 Tax=Listeria grayi TaxID=1641 RepID=D7V0K0_LISGR|nr:phosphate acetyltransferase [Listeria grayi]EFI83082.1 phosphate acetyltransferase [Listeria grayi DSM 20601]EUJ27487.1 phosphotransacetylase [Listeria grayi FSL F6-1183]STY43907.1 Phosphate acetyltransferase [Listeria grayi]VEI35391.1 Phosphate acetyltransferase [Listeria grayi]
MSDLFGTIKQQVTGKNVRIVLPEGEDERIIEATARLQEEGIVVPILLGNKASITEKAAALNISLENVVIRDPESDADFNELVAAFVERRKGKATEEDAKRMLKDPNYFGTMLVFTGKADGLVSGAAHSTGDTVRPALQIIKTKPGISKVAGAMIMVKEDQRYLFSDVAINIAPSAEDLAENAIVSAETASIFGIDPRVAMLSFSTKGSAKSDETEKVVAATAIAQEKAPELALDGEFQFDAAFVPSVAEKKAPGSKIKGDANVFIFPSLEAGNIGYKIAQRLGDFEAVGPILQGLNAPVNDLSRGCNAADVYHLTLITAAQAVNK